MKKSIKQIVLAAIVMVALGSLTSCNRGYGCPDNFSISETATQLVSQAAQSLLQ
jgi:hypothetical protein